MMMFKKQPFSFIKKVHVTIPMIVIVGILFYEFMAQASSGLIVSHQEYTHFVEDKKQVTPWKPPKYEDQESVLGASPELFTVPENLRENWQFWVDIYAKYSSSQGVLHDSIHPHLIYEMIDFSKEEKADLTDSERIAKRKKLVNSRKKHIKEVILSLAKLDPEERDEWSSEQKKFWDLFERIEDPKKYKRAATDGRIRLQLGQRDRFFYGIFYSGRYLHEMEVTFREANLPLQLTRLPFVESSFNLSARSRVGASGIWQFMPRTGRQYMTVTAFIDERNDPIIATRASAKMLKHNFQKLKDWPAAVTAYNFGLYGMRRLFKRYGTSNLLEIIASKKRSRRFGFASANFYFSFLAAVYVEQNADKYFMRGDKLPSWAKKLDYEAIQVDSPVPFAYLVSFFNNNEDLARLYNPHLSSNIRKGYWNIPKGTNFYLQQGKSEDFLENIPKKIEKDKLVYRVKKGDTSLKIARRFKISHKSLIKLNKISNPNYLRIGQVLLIPTVN